MGYLIVITIVLGMFLIYRFSDRIEKNMPWLWKNVAQPIFNYFFVISVRKVTIAYFTTMAGICVAFPAIQFVIDKEHNIEAAITFRRIGQKKAQEQAFEGICFVCIVRLLQISANFRQIFVFLVPACVHHVVV